VLFSLSVFYKLNAQNAVIPNSNKHTVYIDNLIIGNEQGNDFSKIPAVLLENYYKDLIDFPNKHFFGKSIKDIYLEKDTVRHKNSLHIRTKNAKDGYLFVNKIVSEKIQECCIDFKNVTVSYVHNGKIISTKEEVKELLKLRKKKLKILSVTEDKENSVITIIFTDK
jgi:uncharacterized protein involved in tolerance to divalent cations